MRLKFFFLFAMNISFCNFWKRKKILKIDFKFLLQFCKLTEMEGYKAMHVVVYAPQKWLLASNPTAFKEMCITGLAIRAQEIFNGLSSCLTPVFVNYNEVRAKIYVMSDGYFIRRVDLNFREAMVRNYLIYNTSKYVFLSLYEKKMNK